MRIHLRVVRRMFLDRRGLVFVCIDARAHPCLFCQSIDQSVTHPPKRTYPYTYTRTRPRTHAHTHTHIHTHAHLAMVVCDKARPLEVEGQAPPRETRRLQEGLFRLGHVVNGHSDIIVTHGPATRGQHLDAAGVLLLTVHMCVCKCACVCACVRVCLRVRTCSCTQACIHVRACMSVCM